ncbi:uncharacterized protein LOC106657936 [Trichogramma pretiosum]|uniref:uncharacterized protein LOC106657936 n=1 Tax=Trichogramma pretiosum TaxID=7493 RepID=UPI0006C9C355|nr:uncharacterized protein LOC106657936 [Trichogramma pretiosum]
MSINPRLLVHPESLSEKDLISLINKSRCKELPNNRIYTKTELIKIYKKTVLPLPQRQYNVAKYLGKKLHELRVTRKIPTATGKELDLKSSNLEDLSNSANNNRLNQPKDDDDDAVSNVNGLSNLCTDNTQFENGFKRKIDDQNETKKKIQKIMWP